MKIIKTTELQLTHSDIEAAVNAYIQEQLGVTFTEEAIDIQFDLSKTMVGGDEFSNVSAKVKVYL